MVIAKTVFNLISMPKMIQLRTAVNRISIALANVFRILLRFFRKRLVVIPTKELFRIITATRGWKIGRKDSTENVKLTSPCTRRTTKFQKIESTYIKMFWMNMLTLDPASFRRCSLYTPAKQEHRVWNKKVKLNSQAVNQSAIIPHDY